MKKLALILVFILVLGCAFAEPVKVNYMEDINTISYSNLLFKYADNGCALFDYNGNQLTDAVYASSFSYRNGMVMTYLAQPQGDEINRRGILKADGSEVVPFKYGAVDILNENWVYGLTLVEASRDNYDYEVSVGDEKKVYLIDTVDVYSLETGMVKSFTRANYAEIHALGRFVNIMDRSTGKVITYDASFNEMGVNDEGRIYNDEFVKSDFNKFYEDGLYGATDFDGNIVVQPTYDYMYYPDEGEFVLIENAEDQVGVMDIHGSVIVEPQFDEIEYMRRMPAGMDSVYSYDGYVCFVKDGKMGYATAAGITCEAKYSADVLNNNGVSCTFTDMEGNFNIMAADGVITTVTGYEDVTAASYAGGYYYIVSGENYTKGLIDWHGNVVFPCEYRSIEFSGDGQYVLVSPESYGDIEIYTINEAQAAVPAAAEVPAEVPAEAPAAEAPVSGLGSLTVPNVDFSAFSQAAQAPAEAPAAEAPAAPAVTEAPAEAAASGSNAAAITILQNAQALLNADPAANAAAVSALIDSVIALLG